MIFPLVMPRTEQSTSTFDTGTQAVTAMFRIVRSAEDPDNEDLTAAGANIVVVMNSAANHYIMEGTLNS